MGRDVQVAPSGCSREVVNVFKTTVGGVGSRAHPSGYPDVSHFVLFDFAIYMHDRRGVVLVTLRQNTVQSTALLSEVQGHSRAWPVLRSENGVYTAIP